MEPEKLGRTVGIGMRVASNILRDRAGRAMQGNGEAGAQPPPVSAPAPARPPVPRIIVPRQAAEKTRAARSGAKKFGQAIWGPFHHASSLLWLEITGLFFALFAVFFAQNVYRVHTAWKQGGEHTHFLLYVALTAIFVWFSASSFLRARKKSRKAH